MKDWKPNGQRGLSVETKNYEQEPNAKRNRAWVLNTERGKK